jgi:16S rRNA processing protein RimM
MQVANNAVQKEINPVFLGRIVGVFGVKGWIRVFSYTEPRENILEYGNWLLKAGDACRSVTVEEGKLHGKSVIAKLANIENRDAAVELVDSDITVLREELPEIKEGEYYWTDLEGLKVFHRDGRLLGRVTNLLATGVNDVLIVEGDIEHLIPFVMGKFILDVDFVKGMISVDWEWD